RRGPVPGVAPVAGRVDASPAQLRRGLAAGEAGIVVTHVRSRLPADDETAAWWEAVEAVRFLPDGEARLAELAAAGLARVPEQAP
ncbi:MAG TPA: hypothetical protein VFN90_01050, partial [Gemmatimonadales bacterium]|nr:hypothetical protein [Gemmatimonadales bacterium]